MSTIAHRPLSLGHTPRTGVRAWIAAHEVAAFFALAYVLSWALWLAPALGLRGPAGAVLLYAGVFGPALSAAALTRLGGGSLRAWLRELVRFRAAPRWYAAVIGFPIVLVAATGGGFAATGGELEPSLLGERLAGYLPLVVVWTLAGVGEEPGWRGFALPRLLERLSPVRATLLLGTLWALWHLPLLAAADDPSHGLRALPLAGVTALMLLAIVGYAFLYTFLWNRTRSIWLAILLHGSISGAIGAFVLLPSDDQVGGTYAHLQIVTVVVLAIAVALLVRATHARLGLTAPGSVTAARPAALRGAIVSARRDRRAGAAASVAVPAAAAAVLAFLMPRGPITAAEGLATMAAGLTVGVAAGLALRSRWALVLAPLAFAGVYELTRLGTDGPTVDGVHLTEYGLIALVAGRGVHGVLALLPIALGAAIGAGLARRAAGRRARRRSTLYARRAVAAATGLGLVLVALAVARPATTDPILGPDGTPLPGSIAELTRVEIGGHELALLIRGHSTDSPVLLFLAGGPGGSELGAMRRHLESLEEHFVVVTWDQRGTGKSYGALDPAETLTLDRAVADTIEVTNYLRDRFGEEQIYLVGQSWGSTLGVLAAQERPELYRAFVGVGQMVSQRATDLIFYEDTLAWARRRGDDGLVERLTEIGPPPYATILPYEPALSYEHEVYPYDHSRNSEGEGGFSENLLVEEYTLLEQVHALGAMMDTFSVLYPQLQQIDFRRDATRLDVPVYLVQGRHEARGRAVLANEWFAELRAPAKRMVVLGTSGHRPLWEQPDRFTEVMRDIVLAETR